MDQEERLTMLTERFVRDSEEYKRIEIPRSSEEKRVLLRSLMNIRMPREMDEETLCLQDRYLQERKLEKGVVSLKDIPTLEEEGVKGDLSSRLSLWQGDITRLEVDAVVNAANSQMLGCFIPMHTCIDNAIHTFAGIQLRAECAGQMERLRARYGNSYEQPVGEVMLTKGYNLPAKHVLHVVGPMVPGRLKEEQKIELAKCYRNVLKTCRENGLRSVAFCCLSTGVFRFPNEEAADIAVRTVKDFLRNEENDIERVIFNVFTDKDRRIYEKRLYKKA